MTLESVSVFVLGDCSGAGSSVLRSDHPQLQSVVCRPIASCHRRIYLCARLGVSGLTHSHMIRTGAASDDQFRRLQHRPRFSYASEKHEN